MARAQATIASLTDPEKLFLWRRRNGHTQAKAAKRCKVPMDQYVQAERGKDDDAQRLVRVAKVKLGRLEDHERCVVHRRRAKLTIRELAERLGRSRWWINQMELGYAPCEELLAFWK